MTREENLISESVLTRRAVASPQETLVNDSRAGLTPAQMVERKLVAMLRQPPDCQPAICKRVGCARALS